MPQIRRETAKTFPLIASPLTVHLSPLLALICWPWSVVTRRTRGGQAHNKHWALLFTCLCTRAVHIEIVEDMSSSSFINALIRFITIRGRVVQFSSDRGMNFVGATEELSIHAINVEDPTVKNFLFDKGVTWIFNYPQSSHMGDLMDLPSKNLTHEVLVTLMAEVCAILNSHPITSVSTDPECPEVVSPSMLLTQKPDCISAPPREPNLKDMYKSQWKMVQHLANCFWVNWQR